MIMIAVNIVNQDVAMMIITSQEIENIFIKLTQHPIHVLSIFFVFFVFFVFVFVSSFERKDFYLLFFDLIVVYH